MTRTIKLTKKQASLIQNGAGWTPYWFMTSHGIVNIPGPPYDDDVPPGSVWYDDSYECGCCPCCGCRCDEMNEYSYMYYDEEEPE